MKQASVVPNSGLVEEAVFSLAAAAVRDSPTIDSLDWFGAKQSQFAGAGARQYGFPILDLAIRNPGVGAIDLIYQIATQTLPEAAPPVLTFTDRLVVAVPGVSWGELPPPFRLRGRFSRVRIVNTSAALISDIYLWHGIRSA